MQRTLTHEEKLILMKHGGTTVTAWEAPVPPVSGNWDDESWVRWVDSRGRWIVDEAAEKCIEQHRTPAASRTTFFTP